MPAKDHTYDLFERTAVFGENVIEFCLALPATPVTAPLITQFVKAETSLGANYGEADAAETKTDFRHKIALRRKEAKETKHWCRMLAKARATEAECLRHLWKEARELHLIFCKIIPPPTPTCAANAPRKNHPLANHAT